MFDDIENKVDSDESDIISDADSVSMGSVIEPLSTLEVMEYLCPNGSIVSHSLEI